jgi:hypothetical protein
MELLEIPIFKRTVELYKVLHQFRASVPRQDRFTIWQKCENYVLDLLERIFFLAPLPRDEKLEELQQLSRRLNLLRIIFRVCKETKTVDNKKYISIESVVDEIGRMTGGWIKSLKEDQKQEACQ